MCTRIVEAELDHAEPRGHDAQEQLPGKVQPRRLRKGNESKRCKDFDRKPGPESGLYCLVCAEFAGQRPEDALEEFPQEVQPRRLPGTGSA